MSDLLPANLDAEKAVLGAILLDNHAYIEASECLTPDDFLLDSHRRIYRRMCGLLDSSRPCDLVTLTDELGVHKELKPVGDVGYISSLLDGVPDLPSIAEYVAIVKDKALLRRLMRACQIGIERAQGQQTPAIKLLGEFEASVSQIGGTPRSVAKPLRELLPPTLSQMERERLWQGDHLGIPTGIPELDSMVGGIRESELWIAGGLPGKGKTSFGLEFAMTAVSHDVPTCVFSLEMKDWRIVRRLLAGHAKDEDGKVILGASGSRDPRHIPQDRWMQVLESAAKLAKLPLYVDDSSGLSVPELRARIRLYKKRFGIKFIVIDYVRLMTGPGRDLREQVTNIVAGIARTTKEESVSTLLLSQLSRPQDINERPTMTRLKESGDLEANADVVLLLYRPVETETSRPTGKDEIIIGKARDGPVGSIPVVYDERTLTFKGRSFRDGS